MFFFSVFCQGEFRKQPKFHICWFWLEKMDWNGLSSTYVGFEACQIQCHRFHVSVISGSSKNHNIRQKYHIFLILTGKMDWSSLSGAYLGFEVCQIQWHLLQVPTISGSWKITISDKKFHILLILTGTNALKWLEKHTCRVWNMPNPMALVASPYNKWFMKNHNFRHKFHILLILTGNNALKLLEWCIFKVRCMLNSMALVASPYDNWFMKNHNFRRHIAAKWGSNPWKWDGTYAAVLLGSHFTLTPCFRTQYLDLPITNAGKP